MKPPYVKITATCSSHGSFQVERKPNKRETCSWNQGREGLYDAVKCPKCSWWGTIIKQELVSAEPVTPPTAAPLLPGMEG